MKITRTLCILLAVSFFGGVLGYRLFMKRPAEGSEKRGNQAPAGETAAVTRSAPSGPVVGEIGNEPDLDYPPGAISGELTIQLNSREDYEALLQELANAGLSPLGRIDQLWAVRLPQRALGKINLGRYDLRPGYSYRIVQPPIPERIAPEVLASLRGFGASARAITKGPLSGEGGGIRVAVLDSGVLEHPQFDDVDVTRLDLADGGKTGPGATHGTSVASIIAGREGIAPQADLISVRVLDGEGAGNSFQVAEGIIQAVDQGAQVINMSLGVYEDSALLRQAVRYAHDQGVVMVAAAGNDGFDRMSFPAAYSEVLAVTAVDAAGNHARFPNQSTAIDFAAPGVGILAAGEDEGTLLFSGTSAAAPFVTGSLASLLSAESPPTPEAAVKLLSSYLNEQGAAGSDPLYGAGVLDWDRLRERSTPDLMDMALADIYLAGDTLPGTTTQIEVTVQNRGTKWVGGAELEVLVGEDEPVRFTLSSLSPGQSTTRKIVVSVPSRESDGELNLAARVHSKNSREDIRPENNLKAVRFRPSF
ncbi:MAG: S8 family serine peptidase [Verrucomicrobia bacterium]|jgi:hypothetical protein|nr:S8 family serine peptidase [Verrucomicrobiota bacterium]